MSNISACRFALSLLCWIPLSGCFAPIKTTLQRTALAQQVTTAAIERAVEAIDLSEAGLKGDYQIRVTGPENIDREVVMTALRNYAIAQGLGVATQDGPILEANVAYAGSDLEFTLFGIPLFVPGYGVPLADVSIYKSSTLRGRAKIGLSVWDSQGTLTQRIPAAEGTTFYRNITFLTFFGAFARTDLEEFRRRK